MPQIIRPENCTNCKFSFAANPQMLVCRRMPPVPQVIPAPGGFQTVGAFSPVTADIWCAEYKRKLLVVEGDVTVGRIGEGA